MIRRSLEIDGINLKPSRKYPITHPKAGTHPHASLVVKLQEMGI